MWDAFQELNTDRPVGLSQGPIPWGSLDRYAARHGIEGEDFEDFTTLVRCLDNAYLAFHGERGEQKRKEKPRGT